MSEREVDVVLRCRERANKGFTLLEMLLAVALVGTLVAISIPVFNNSLERAKATACLANRENARREMVYDMMTELRTDLEEEAYIRAKGLRCPSGEHSEYDIYVFGQMAAVVCPVHGVSGQMLYGRLNKNPITTGSTELIDGGTSFDTIMRNLYAVIGNNTFNVIDSNLTGTSSSQTSFSSKIRKYMADMTSSDFNISAWRATYVSGAGASISYQLYWTEEDLSTKNKGDMVLALRYNSNLGTYTTCYVPVSVSNDSEGNPYKILDVSKSATNGNGYFEATVDEKKATNEQKRDYEQSLAFYREVVRESRSEQ